MCDAEESTLMTLNLPPATELGDLSLQLSYSNSRDPRKVTIVTVFVFRFLPDPVVLLSVW